MICKTCEHQHLLYEELRLTIQPFPDFMDKRTDVEAHADAIREARKLRGFLEAAHDKLIELGIKRGVLDLQPESLS